MVETKGLSLVVCPCGCVKHYQDWEMMTISFSVFIKTIMENGIVSIELMLDKCPACTKKEEEMAGIA